MKKQIIITICTGIILALIIYKLTYHDEMKILSLGDSLSLGMTFYNIEGYSYNDYLKDYFEKNSLLKEYIKEYSTPDETPKTLLTKITNNEKNPQTNQTIQHDLKTSKLITISIGMEYLNTKKTIKTKDITEYLIDMEKLIKQIRIFNQKELFIISLYESPKLNSNHISLINKELKKIAQNYHCTYIDITNITKKREYFFSSTNFYLNYKGHQYISELIINQLN